MIYWVVDIESVTCLFICPAIVARRKAYKELALRLVFSSEVKHTAALEMLSVALGESVVERTSALNIPANQRQIAVSKG